MNHRKSFLVLGGDARQQYLLSHLTAQGCPCQDAIRGDALESASLSRYIREADVICGPIPFSVNGRIKGCALTVTELAGQLHPGQWLFGGGLPDSFAEHLTLEGIKARDYLKDQALASYNTIATAEGILADMITSYPDNLFGTSVLVLGYGRCAVTLADRLRQLGAATTVCARREASLGQARSLGHQTLPLSALGEQAARYPLIVNTIPALVLGEAILATLPGDTRLYDIASAPGGIDFEKAKALGLTATLHPGLPGRYAPKASARAMYQCITSTLESGL